MHAEGPVALALPDDLVAALFNRARELGLLKDGGAVGGGLDTVAGHFGVSARRVRDWRERGCPATKVGRRLWFRFSEVSAWLDQQERA